MRTKMMYLSIMALALTGCNGADVSGPTPNPTPTPAAAVQMEVGVVPTPDTTTDVGHTYEATLKDNGEFSIKNTGKIPRTFYAYSYKVWKGGEQTLIDKQFTTVQPGDTFSGQLAVAKCETQLDLSGIDTPTGKINPGEIAHKIVKRGTPLRHRLRGGGVVRLVQTRGMFW